MTYLKTFNGVEKIDEIIANGLTILAKRVRENKIRIYNSEDLGM